MQIRQRVVETISVATSGYTSNWLITVKMSKVEERGDQIVVNGTYEYFSQRGTFVVTLRKQDLSVLNYELR